MSDIRVTPIANRPTRVEPVSQTLPKSVPAEHRVDQPESRPDQERRQKQRRKGRAYRRPLIELRTGDDRRRSQNAIDTDV